MKNKKQYVQALKIAIGSSLAIYLCTKMNLQFATSAGTIALLTIVSTKWGTIRISLYRILSFGVSAALAAILFQVIRQEWIAFGVYIFLLVLICDVMGWRTVLSVNAVIGIHFLSEKDFSYVFIKNEFFLIMVGITLAVILNLFHGNKYQKNQIILNLHEIERELQLLLGGMAAYLENWDMQWDIWEKIQALEVKIQQLIEMAYEYQDNTFPSHPRYYIDYFEMRLKQCNILRSLHDEMKKIRKVPKQAKIISEYIYYMIDYVVEKNEPANQLNQLNLIFQRMKNEPLPKSREEFENRAMLYHILMDLEEFLKTKKRLVNSLNEKQKKIYWGQIQ